MVTSQEMKLLLGFHALRNHFHMEIVAHGNDGLRNRRIAFARQVGQEGTVDLDEVDREALQAAQARVAGAEIVDRQLNAQCLEPAQRLRCLLRIVHQLALRQF